MEQLEKGQDDLTYQMVALCGVENVFEYVKDTMDWDLAFVDALITVKRHTKEVDSSPFDSVQIFLHHVDDVLAIILKLPLDVLKLVPPELVELPHVKLDDLHGLLLIPEILWLLKFADQLFNSELVVHLFKLVDKAWLVLVLEVVVNLL